MQELDSYTNKLSYDIIGSAIEVHKILGAGLLESAYETALKFRPMLNAHGI